MTYDKTQAYFQIVVTDNNIMDNTLEYTVVAGNNTTVNGNKVSASFTNSYHSTTANINIQKNLTNNTGVDISMDNFKFALLDKDKNPVSDAYGNPIVVTPNVKGVVNIPITYVSTDFANISDTLASGSEVTKTVVPTSVVVVATSDTTKTENAVVKIETPTTYTLTETYYLRELAKDGDDENTTHGDDADKITGMTYVTEDYPISVTVIKNTVETTYANRVASYEKIYQFESDGTTPKNDAQGNHIYEWQETSVVDTPFTDTEYNNTYIKSTSVLSFNSEVAYNGTDTLATFNNAYSLDDTTATIGGVKTFTGRDMISEDKFTFELYKADKDYAIADYDNNSENGNTPVSTADVTGPINCEECNFTLTTQKFTKAGTYHFVVKESVPAQAVNNVLNGVTYDPSEYRVEIVVAPHASESRLEARINSIVQVGGNNTSIVFNNTYSITGTATAEISVNKVLTGRALNSGEFTFHLYNKDDVIIDSDGKVVVENGAVAVKDDATPLQTATNSAYNAVDGTKYTGTVVFEDVGSYTQTGAYEQIGTYEYVIVEDKSYVKGGVTYDETPYVYAKVEVKDNGDGTLATEVTYSADGVTYGTATAAIENSYSATPVTISIRGDKRYVDENNNKFDLTEYGEFKFLLQPANDKYVVDTEKDDTTKDDIAKDAIEVSNGKNSSAKDQFAFDLTYDTKGTYYYVLREEPGTSVTTVYDAAVYHVMVVVQDNGEGALTAVTNVTDLHGNHIVFDWDSTLTEDAQKRAEFVNIEKSVDPIDVTFNIKKAITKLGTADHTLGGFKFEITKDGEVQTTNPVSDNNGDTAFTDRYTKADIGKTFVYTIKEVDTGIANMEYDQRTYTVEVTVNYVAEQLVTSIKQNSTAVDNVIVHFNNSYSGNVPKPDSPIDPGKVVNINPNTGDTTNNIPYIIFMAASAVGLIAVLLLMKKEKDEEDEAEA